jgi:hypothetical protein
VTDHRLQLEEATRALTTAAERLGDDELPDERLREVADEVSRLSAEVARLLPLVLSGDA